MARGLIWLYRFGKSTMTATRKIGGVAVVEMRDDE